MKTLFFVFFFLIMCLLFSFRASKSCEYARSNISYIKAQTEAALDAKGLNNVKLITYRAIKAIYKSKQQLKDCGCKEATITIEEAQDNLIKSTKAASIQEVKTLLKEAYQKILASLASVEKHHLHENQETKKDQTISKLEDSKKINSYSATLENKAVQKKIDASLLPYEKSIQKVVDSLQCEEARVFTNRIFENCEQELLRSDLSEAAKYYNLKTQEITARALERLGDCGVKKSN